MSEREKKRSTSPVASDQEPEEHNRGKRAVPGTGDAEGAGSGAGGGGTSEDYDPDPVGGGGRLPFKFAQPVKKEEKSR